MEQGAARVGQPPHLTNPQTLNLYAMASDDPETFADLDGHTDPPGGAGDLACKDHPQCADPKTAPPPAQNQKPLTPAQIKKAFYKQHGKALNAAISKVFGKDSMKLATQP